jgi:hypothetical protein
VRTEKFIQAVVIEKNLGHQRKNIIVVDQETGEIVVSAYDSRELFPDGCKANIAQLLVGKEELPNGAEYITISDLDQNPIFQFWHGRHGPKKGKSTGGKPAYLKVYQDNFMDATAQLTDGELGFLMRLLPIIEWDSGELIDRKKKQPASVDELAKRLDASPGTIYRKMAKLENAGLVRKVGDKYLVDRNYIAKG